MTLSCSCDYDYDWEPGTTMWREPSDYLDMYMKRSQRCTSCNTLIKPGELCSEIARFKVPEYELEVNIYGEDGEIPRASKFMCEHCTDIYFSLQVLGFCMNPNDNMNDSLNDFHTMVAAGATSPIEFEQ